MALNAFVQLKMNYSCSKIRFYFFERKGDRNMPALLLTKLPQRPHEHKQARSKQTSPNKYTYKTLGETGSVVTPYIQLLVKINPYN